MDTVDTGDNEWRGPLFGVPCSYWAAAQVRCVLIMLMIGTTCMDGWLALYLLCVQLCFSVTDNNQAASDSAHSVGTGNSVAMFVVSCCAGWISLRSAVHCSVYSDPIVYIDPVDDPAGCSYIWQCSLPTLPTLPRVPDDLDD